MYDSTLFDHIKSMIPHRAHESVGLLIEPHLLERPKFSGWKPVVKEETHFRNTNMREAVGGEPHGIDYYDKGANATASTAGSFRYNSGSVDMGTDKMQGFADLYDEKKYMECPFIAESLSENTQLAIKEKGLRNIAIMSIAPTGSISNIVVNHI